MPAGANTIRYSDMAPYRGVDYMHIDSLLTEEELLIRQTIREFVDHHVKPVIRDCYNEGRFPQQIVPLLGELGIFGANLDGYGCAGMSNVDYGLIMQELERGDSGVRSFDSVQTLAGDVSDPLLRLGGAEAEVAAAGWPRARRSAASASPSRTSARTPAGCAPRRGSRATSGC